ncbi:protein kinase domain-containing protein [Streptomyces chartreusis]|uniref:protein kinase domain-containing protein n=1 Tax=Streptomyces chartreusis TaxID=1969 RepID=UPI0036454114
MELVPGIPLSRRLKEPVPPWPLAVGWAAQIAEALHAAHSQDIVHRDIKPANALLTPDGTVKVLDFGIAKFLGETISAHKLTTTGSILGSPWYMSPEQGEGAGKVDHRSDLYSMGCLLYHAVTGRPPFEGDGDHPLAIILKHMQETPTAPGGDAEGLPDELNDLIMSLLAKRPDDRPASAAAVRDALSTVLVDHAVPRVGRDTSDVAHLRHVDSVSGLILKRAWELFQGVERQGATQRAAEGAARVEAHQILRRARADAKRVLSEAYEEAEANKQTAQDLLGEASDKATKTLREASDKATEATAAADAKAARIRLENEAEIEQLRADAGAEAEKIRTEASEYAARQIRRAEEFVKELLLKAPAPEGPPRLPGIGNLRANATARWNAQHREASEILELLREQAETDNSRLPATTNSGRSSARNTDESSARYTNETTTWRRDVEEILGRAGKQRHSE